MHTKQILSIVMSNKGNIKVRLYETKNLLSNNMDSVKYFTTFKGVVCIIHSGVFCFMSTRIK